MADWAELGRSVAYQAARDGSRRATTRAARRGEKQNQSGPEGGSFGPWPYFRVKNFSNFQTTFQLTNYFEFNSNLNFE
jgi:hypothetical protein